MHSHTNVFSQNTNLKTYRRSCRHPAEADAEACRWGGWGAGWRPGRSRVSCRWRCPLCARRTSPWTRAYFHWAPACCRRSSQRWARRPLPWGCNQSSWCKWQLPSRFPWSEPAKQTFAINLFCLYQNIVPPLDERTQFQRDSCPFVTYYRILAISFVYSLLLAPHGTWSKIDFCDPFVNRQLPDLPTLKCFCQYLVFLDFWPDF